jgi:DNA (cytosine-5)-methyltransferase 1
MKFKIGELFSGPGGLSLGAINAKIPGNKSFKISHGWASDYDKDSCETYKKTL